MKKSLGRVEGERDHSEKEELAFELSFKGYKGFKCVTRSQVEAIGSRSFKDSFKDSSTKAHFVSVKASVGQRAGGVGLMWLQLKAWWTKDRWARRELKPGWAWF